MKKPICVLLCALVCGISLGQDYYFKHYSVENGLSYNSVLSTFQDHHGFLWFGTKDGLNRFDGYSFKVFSHDPKDSTSVSNNKIWSLVEYKDHLWVGTDNGLNMYDEENETFHLIKETQGSYAQNLMNDGEGNIWFIQSGTLYKYGGGKNPPQGFNSFNATSVIHMQDGTVISSSHARLHRYDKRNNSFNAIEIPFEGKENRPFIITKLFALDPDTILIGTQNHGVLIYSLREHSVQKLLPDSENPLYVRDFAKKGQNELWLATESGAYIYNLKDKSYLHLKKKYNNPYALSDNALYSLTIDKEGGVWIGTYFAGVEYYPNQLTPFKKYFQRIGENSLNGNVVREIHRDYKGNLWLGTEDMGLNKLNPATGVFTHYKNSKDPGSLSYNNIHGIYPDGDRLWIGTFEHGLDVMDIPTGKVIKHYDMTGDHGLKSNFIYSFYKTRSQDLLVLTTQGVQAYDAEIDGFLDVEGFPKKLFLSSFLEDKNGDMWAGTFNYGLLFYSPSTKTKKTYVYSDSDPKSISNNTVNGIYEDSKNRIWITTDNGLNRYSPDTDGFIRYTVKNGFPSNILYSILEGEDHTLWISTSKGLVNFNPETEGIKVYTQANGLLNNQFNYSSAYKDKNGRMYFGSLSGMISFNPRDFKHSTYKPPILITGFQINNKEVPVNQNGSPLNRSVTHIDQIKLNYDQSSFSIDFATLSYTSPGMTDYWYKLQGLSDSWIELKKNHKVYFTELSAGTYNFMVKSKSSNGEQSEETSALKIVVMPPFYASNLAYFLYFCLASLLFYLGLRYYHRQTKAKNKLKIRQLNNRKEREIYQAKIEFFTNVSHEIRTPLTLIKSPLDKMLKKEGLDTETLGNLSIMEKNTSRLLDLVNQLLDFKKTELQNASLTFVETNFSELVRQIYERFSQSIQEKGIDFELVMDEDDIYAFVDAETMRKTLGNLFNNARKYSENLIKATLYKENESLVFTIKNDGYLIPEYLKEKIFEPFYRVPNMGSQTGTGIGLSMASSFAAMHKGDLVLDTTNGKMNTFVLRLPLHQEREFTLHPPKNSKAIPPMEEIPPENPEIETGKIPILLVEDNEDLLNFICKDLKETYTVLKALNGKDALEIFEDRNIQLVISDVMMPGMDGFTLCRTIKTKVETSHVPVILLTAKNAFHAKMEGLEAGADAYLEKPFVMEHLRAQITNLLENRKTIRAFYASSPLAHLKSIALTTTDESFLRKLDDIIVGNISDSNMSVDTLAEAMHVSRSSLYRKIKEISDLSPNELINLIRLKRSAELLKTKEYKIYEIAEMVGYNSQTSFGRNFQKQFNMTPTEYMNS